MDEDFSFDMSSTDQATAVAAGSKPFIVARSRCIVPKQRRIERLPSGYAVQECSKSSEGDYWFVVTALEVVS
jgi:hypothetical protein